MGAFATVIANDSASIKEVMLNTKLDGRPDLVLTQMRDPNNVTRGVYFGFNPKHNSQIIIVDNVLFLKDFCSCKAYIGEIRDVLR